MDGPRIRDARGCGRFIAVAFVLVSALARSTEAGVVGDVEVIRAVDSTEISVRFSAPLRYLRHAPQTRGRSVVIQLDPLSGGAGESAGSDRREWRRLPPGNPAAATEIVLEGGADRGFRMEIRFLRAVNFEVKPGADPFRLALVLRDETSREEGSETSLLHSVQIHAGPAAQGLPTVEVGDLPPQASVYALPYRHEGEPWIRLRVGFFASRSEAEVVQRQLARRFPGAWVATSSRSEQLAASRLTLSSTPREMGEEARTGPPSEVVAPPRSEPQPSAAEAGISAANEARVASWMEAGRNQLSGDSPAVAIPFFTKVVSLPHHARSAEAKELLGVARERNDQLAHAKAEYEEYLESYPDGEGASRVRQRLDALLTAAAPDREVLPAPRAREALRYDLFGTLSSYYRFGQFSVGDLAFITTESALDSDLFLGARARLESVDLRGEFSGFYLGDFTGAGDHESRIRTLHLEAKERGGAWSGVIGRESPRGSGIVEPYDGLGLRYGFPSGVGLALTGGFPVNVWDSNQVRFDRHFVGIDLDFRLGESLFGNVFGVYYDAEGFVDRVGLGGELRYAGDRLSLTALVDADPYYRVLNTAFVSGFLQLADSTHLNLLIDHRRAPILRTRNALIGQIASQLGDLSFDVGEIEDLARDRSARSSVGSIGISHRYRPDLLISGDFSISHLTATDGSGGVPATDSFGPDYAIFAQLLANDWLMQGGIATAGIRLQLSDDTKLVMLVVEGRYPLLQSLLIAPRLGVAYRDMGDQGVVSVEPTLRAEYRFLRFTLDTLFRYLWRPGVGASPMADERGFSLSVGLRFDF